MRSLLRSRSGRRRESPGTRRRGLPRSPRNKALDRIRRESKRTHKEQEAIQLLDSAVEATDGIDDRLRLIFTCCHPALSPEARVALALRVVCGVTTPEIARAFLVAEPTMGQRISRAKKKIATAHIPYRVPPDHELPDRLPAVLATIYLIFTTGYHAPAGNLDARVELASEGVRLARLLVKLMPDEAECIGLLALLLLTHARRDTRLADDGSIILLAHQDRSLWDREAIDEGQTLIAQAIRRRNVGPYQIQASIAGLHAGAQTYGDTDWEQIVTLYRMLEHIQPTPVVRVNRAVAEAELAGPQAGLDLLDGVDGAEGWHLYWSSRAALLRRADQREQALHAYRRALDLTMNDSDRRFLIEQVASLETSPEF